MITTIVNSINSTYSNYRQKKEEEKKITTKYYTLYYNKSIEINSITKIIICHINKQINLSKSFVNWTKIPHKRMPEGWQNK